MKICVLSDIHGNLQSFKKVVEYCKLNEINEYIFLGDLVFKGSNPKEVLDIMKEIKPLCWIKGNTDEALELIKDWKPKTERECELYSYYMYALEKLTNKDLELLKSKSIKESIEIEDVKIMCVHGSPRKVDEGIEEDLDNEKLEDILELVEERVLLCGHTHVPFIKEVNDTIIVNVGSVGIPKNGVSVSFGIISIESNNIQIEMIEL